ncbi:hypothetical protein A5868_003488, partial [Enterococcus sp. 12F9_DIV0723]
MILFYIKRSLFATYKLFILNLP